MMEDEERQKKLEAGKAKLAEYRQRKAYADSQKKQKKKKKKRTGEDSEGDSQGRPEVDPDQSADLDEVSGGGRDGSQEGNKDSHTTEFTFAKTLRSGETVKHDQTYTIEPESEVSTTAEDYSSEVNGLHDEMIENLLMSPKDFIWEEVEHLQQVTKGGTIQDMEDALSAKTQAVQELSQELEEIRAAFGTEGVNQLQDFEAALKQRDGIITQLTTNLQQAREEKDEIMKEFLELTEQSQKLQIQFQLLQAGETLRNTSHSSTAADLLQARQQIVHYQQQLEEMNVEVRNHQERSSEQQEHISQLQLKVTKMEMLERSSEESFTQRINKKDLLIGEKEKVIASQEQLLTELRTAEESFAQILEEKSLFISQQTAIITEHEQSLVLLREELAHVGRTDENSLQQSDENDLIIAEQKRVISERDCSLTQLKGELESSEKCLHGLQQQMSVKESELQKSLDELENTKSDLESCRGEMESCKLELEKEREELEICKDELSTSRQKERMSSNEIMQLMGTVEDLQRRCHQGSLSESDAIQKMQDESVRKLEVLRAELDEMYGQQIVQMKQELNLQHAAKMEQMTELHNTELELLKAQLSQNSAVSTSDMDSLNVKINALQETLEESQAMHDKTKHELSQVTQEKFNLQVQVEDLLQNLHSANEKVELVSHNLISQESLQDELQCLQGMIDSLKGELAAAQEAAQETEIKHESEVTNYKIKLEMLEREKDAVLDRMAESQEAELERLRTQLLFSHEEELTHLRDELQRESFLNTESLLNEAAIKHQKALDELRLSYEEELRLSQQEKGHFATERDELLHQIFDLKEDLKVALHSSKADELVQQLQELQGELEELRKGGEERARMENEIQTLVKKTDVLEKQTKDKEQSWENKWKQVELEIKTLTESNNTLKEELDSKCLKIETLTTDKNQIQQEVDLLREEIENQKTTFSFAEKNFEVNYQELKEEYMCLIDAKKQFEERTLNETLKFEVEITSLQSQIQELKSSRDIKMEETITDGKALVQKDLTELMEKLNVTMTEKQSLAGKLSEVAEQLMFTGIKVEQLEEELTKLRKENTKVISQNESLEEELKKKQEQMRGQDAKRKAQLQKEEQASKDHHSQIQSLREEIKALQSLLQAAEAERDNIRQTLDVQQLSQPPSAATVQSSGEGPVEGRSSLQKPTASGSNRRKRRQRLKQERKLGTSPSDSREERHREDEEEAEAEEERATSVAAQENQPQMERQVMSCSQEKSSKEDSTDEYQGDGDYINKQVSGHRTDNHQTEPVVCQRVEEEDETTEHGECRLQMEAQRISLSQIHAAQLELLQEETDARTHSLELKLQSVRSDLDEPRTLKYQNMLQAVSEECSEIVLSFRKIFGGGFLESVDDAGCQLPSEERPETSESTSIILEARELYIGLQQVRERIEQEHERLSQIQALLRADGSKMMELQMTYDELKSSSEKEISDLRVQVASFSSSSIKGSQEQTGAPSTPITEELLRLKVEAQEKQLLLEQSHRQEMEHLRAHYQQKAIEAEERSATELFMLQQRLHEVTGSQSHYSLSTFSESSSERMEEHSQELKDLGEEELSEEHVKLYLPTRSAGLTAQLQALRKALYHKYVQEVATLKEQHNSELRRLREEREQESTREEPHNEREEREQDIGGINTAGNSRERSGAAEQVVLEENPHWERVEEEVAKVIVQMSVAFAQQTEIARINKHTCQASTSMQTQSLGSRLEELERERLEKDLEERNLEIQKLKEVLQKTEQTLKKRRHDQGEIEEEEDLGGLMMKEPHADESATSPSSQDDGESSDKDVERNLLRKANEKLSQVLVDVLKTTAAAEETIGLHMQNLCGASGERQLAALPPTASESVNTQPFEPFAPGETAESFQGSETCAGNVSLWSTEREADDGLEVSQQMMDSLLLGAETQLENEELLMGIGTRLQTALEKMLMAITDATNQLEHARMTQTELMRESFRRNQEISELLQKQEELQERLTEEARAREQLALELHRAEGLIDGYTGERAAVDEQLRQKEELQMSLEQELQVTSSRLQELEQERLQMQEERELLSRQQDAMREDAGPRELHLLEETEKLMKEKVEVQRQAEKENSDLLKQVKLLETELEEQVNRVIELEHAQTTENGDLRQQLQALEKQLEKNRRFLDEQAVDREHERDFFQQEIQTLEKQLKNPQRLQTGSEQRNQEVEQLTSQLKEKADWCSELLLSSEQLRRDLKERDEEIDKLESRIHELEQALLASAESLEKAEQKKQHASITETRHSSLEAQLQTEREALERKEKEICNLEEQLEQFREELENKSEEVQQLHMQLEIQSKEISSQQEYLETRDSMLQVMEEKDREIALLNEQITKLGHTETASDNKEIDERDDLIKDLESKVECLQGEKERLKRNSEEELDQLNAVIEKLQQELVNIEQKQAAVEDEDIIGEQEQEYDEMKHRMELATTELNILKTEGSKLLETHLCLKESADALAETQKLSTSEGELEEALREKTACLVVMQAQVQALEQSATSRVEELGLRIQELEDLVSEKDSELSRCHLLVQQGQSYADGLQQRVSTLEENLREKIAVALVSQVTQEALQQQRSHISKENQDIQRHAEPHVKPSMQPHVHGFGDFGIPQMDFSGLGEARQVSTGKVVHLTQKLRELEVGLGEMQKDQELQKQLLSSSEEEVLEYERRLAVLMDLLIQMKAIRGHHQKTSPAVEASSADHQPAVSELLQELQEVNSETVATKEQLISYKESCSRLQNQLQEKTVTIERLQDQLQKVSTSSTEEVKLQDELMEARDEATATKEELNSCRETLEKLQELLQEREMTIAHLKGELFQVKSVEGADSTELLQELQAVRDEVASTKEELCNYRRQNEKLQEELQVREISISKLKEEQQQLIKDVDITKEELTSYRQQNEKLQQELQVPVSLPKHEEDHQQLTTDMDTTKEEFSSYRQQNEKLLEELKVGQISISKLREEHQQLIKDMDTTKEKLSSYRQQNEKLQEELQVRDVSISKFNEEHQQLMMDLDTTKKELTSYRQQNDKLQEELQVRDVSNSDLKEEIQQLMMDVDTTKEDLSSYRKQNEKLQEELQVQEVLISKLREEHQVAMIDVDTTKEELSSYRQQNEKLKEELQVREVPISKINEEQQQLKMDVDTTNKELSSYRQQNEKLQEELQDRELSISKLKEENQQLMVDVDITKEELSSYRQQNEKLQEELQVREVPISKINEEKQLLTMDMDTTNKELSSYRQQNEKLQEDLQDRELCISKLKEENQQLMVDVDTIKEELSSYRQQNEKLQEELQVREVPFSKINKEQQQQLMMGVDTTNNELSSYRQQNEKLQEELQDRELCISKLKEENQQLMIDVDTIKEELSSYRQQNKKLQEELQVREVPFSKINKEQQQQLTMGVDTTNKELSSYRQQNEKLQEELQDRELCISKLKEENQQLIIDADTTKEQLSIYRKQNEKLQEELQVRDVSISKLKEENQQLMMDVDTTKEALSSYRQQIEKLMQELHNRELSISKLKKELQDVQTALLKTADSGPPSPSPSHQPQSSSSSSSTTQPKRKGAKQSAIKGSAAKDKLSLSKKNSAPSSQSSSRSHSSLLNCSNEHQHVTVTDSFTQTEPFQMYDLSLQSKSVAKEEMEEVISEFQEKIVQMQELHAAEILDMEARHISESENLRRDTNALEDECKALKAVIDKLRSTEAPTSRQDRPTPQFKDGYTSDSSSDYSQRTGYDLPNLQQEFRTTPDGARIETDDPMPDRIKMLLREVHQEGMQVLSLSELPTSEGEPGNQFNIQGWLKERDALLATVESLKGLITQMQTSRETQTSGSVDWRAQLLDAVRQVFLRERSVLKMTLYSQLDLLDTSDAIIHLNQLERRLAEQDAHHRDAMDSLHTAERSSLISEIHHLRGQLEQLHQGAQSAVPLAAEFNRREQREGGAGETNRLLVEELKCELSQTKLELETTLKTQHKHFKELDTLRAEVSKKAAEMDALSDQLIDERKRSRDLQWAMEKDKCRTGRTEESKREELEDLHLSLEEQKSRVAQLTLTLDQERQASSLLSQQAEEEHLSLHRRLQELQVQFETEQAKALEISTALGRERELRTGVSSNNSFSNEAPVETDSRDDGSLLVRLQRDLDDKHAQVVHLFSQVEAHKLEVVRKEEELMLLSQRSRRDQEALMEARTQLENLRAQISGTQEQLEREMERRRSLEEEKERLEERVNQVGEQQGQRQESGPQQTDRHSPSALHRDSGFHTTDWVSQLKSGTSNTSPLQEVSAAAHSSGPHHGPWRTVDKIIGKLHLVSSKICSMSNQTPGRLTAEVDREELSWVQSSVDEVINMLQQFPSLPSVPESVSRLAGGSSSSSSSSNSLTERLLRQNAELTGFVSRLTEEKNDLRNHVLRLEDELRRYRHSGLGSGDSSFSQRLKSNMDSASTPLAHERETWTREKIRLEKALHLAQSQVARLRGEVRSDTLREITGPEADNAALKRMYGRYLRSESFRKALIYQKKYLLLLLGGFQECEEATLSLLCRMGGQPSLSSLESYSQRRRGLTRFRSAVRVSIALSRMRFLVRRWHKATGMSLTTSCSLNKNGTGQTFSTEMRDSPYLHPGSAEIYREKGGRGGGGGVSSSRGRSGRESPRSAVSSTPHRYHMAGDHGALTCSHLQSYDPDRALTDYISRLEALQRRLGSVTSGASSYANLHFGLRR
ncbi:A-kinase anchor protein 9 isoform X2 [Solea solea]|uniref:A-kinase anchor protein 9 isoform X2 n=1 Tax=Solea solea TaxID=90069 RepID=UPI00272CB218|nr:A-kinase anchor protein 9 isoform X2 [Solea solea]